MRYNLESTLPIHAFQPLGGRHNPFKQRMTLEGGNPVAAITNPISKVLGTDGSGGGISGALASVDKAVGNTIPGGWATVAAVAVPYAAPYLTGAALTAGQAAALSAGTSAATSAIQGRNLEDTLKAAALAGATTYGLQSLGAANNLDDLSLDTPYVDLPDGEVLLSGGAPDLSGISLPTETPYVDLPDEAVLFNPTPSSAPSAQMPSEVLDMPDAGISYSPSVPAELSLDTFYQDLPDGINQFPSSFNQEAVAASNIPSVVKDEETFENLIKRMQDSNVTPSVSYDPDSGVKITDFSTPASEETQRMVDMGILERTSEMPGYLYETIKRNPVLAASLGLGALAAASGGEEPQEEQAEPSKRVYEYGSGSNMPLDNYVIGRGLNARNVYGSGFAEGGEVKHFALGGLSRGLTKIFQPVEKAVLQPIGQAAPFLKDVAPYAGILAAPFLPTPYAVGVGALSSGFGQPGGFNMKRALMGGIAAYGASTVGAGLEAAGTDPVTASASNLVSAPSGAVGESLVNQTSSIVSDAPKSFFRDPSAMQRGIGRLVGPNSDAAAKAFGTQAGVYKSGIPLVMGTSGIMAIDEAQNMQEQADAASAPARQANADMLARISASKERARQAVMENPFRFAAGGSVDDDMGSDYNSMNQGNLDRGLFDLGSGKTPVYASGGLLGYEDGDIVGYAGGGGITGYAGGGDVARYVTGGEVAALYQSILGRAPDAAGAAYWAGSGLSASQIANAISSSPEAQVKQVFEQQLGRAPDTGGAQYYQSQVDSGRSIADISKEIAQSKEGQKIDKQAATSAYRQALGRNPEPEGLQYWLSTAQAYGLTQKELIDNIQAAAIKEQGIRGLAPGTKFTDLTLASLESDPLAGYYSDFDMYDIAPDAENVSMIGDRPAQFTTAVTRAPVVTTYKDGVFTSTPGKDMLNTPHAQAAINVARANGTLSEADYQTFRADLDKAVTADDVRAAYSKPQARVVIDAIQGQQMGEGKTLADAQAEAAQRQPILSGMDQGYYLSNAALTDAYKAAGVSIPADYSFYEGVDTRDRTSNIFTPERLKQTQQDFANFNPFALSNIVNAENVYTFDQPQQAAGLAQIAQQAAAQPAAIAAASSANIYTPEQTPTGMARGGVARFLSGGGDGMSDSIRANIEGTQEARLADGEFVIPADVVSHLGNGSSKAGAKQLYSMMDRVRKARTGNEKQGRQIKPRNMMPA